MRIRDVLSEYHFRPMLDDADDVHTESPEMDEDWGEFVIKVRKRIEENCSEILEVYRRTQRLLYRGIDDTEHPLFRAKIKPHHRDPSLSPHAYQLVVHAMNEQAVKANLHNSLICSSDPRQAVKNGSLYVILPFDGFRYTWSKRHFDLLKGIQNDSDVVLSTFDMSDAADGEAIREAVIEAELTNTGIDAALSEHHDIILSGVDYFGLRATVWKKYMENWIKS